MKIELDIEGEVKGIPGEEVEPLKALTARYPHGMALKLKLPDGLPPAFVEVAQHFVNQLPKKDRREFTLKLDIAARMLIDQVCEEIEDQFFVLANQKDVREDIARFLADGKGLVMQVERVEIEELLEVAAVARGRKRPE